MKLKPSSADVHLIYICPKCEAKHYVRQKETIFPGGILCSCDKKLVFERITHIDVNPVYGPAVAKVKNVADEKPNVNLIEDKAKGVLISYGYSATEANDLIKKGLSSVNNPNDAAEIVKAALQQVEV